MICVHKPTQDSLRGVLFLYIVVIAQVLVPRNTMTKDEIKNFVLKCKNELYNGTHMNKGGEWHDGAHYELNRILDKIDEYAR